MFARLAGALGALALLASGVAGCVFLTAGAPLRNVGRINPCAGIVLELNLSQAPGVADCWNRSLYPSALSIPGLSYTPATVSGTGATDTTATDSAGLVHDFASGARRLTSAGLLLENASTNLVLHSQDSMTSSGAYWGCYDATWGGNSQGAPDGTSTASLMTYTGGSAQCGNNSGGGFSQAASTQYTVSVYFFPVSGTSGIGISVSDGTNSTEINCTTSSVTLAPGGTTGYTGVNGEVIALGTTGWYRCVLTFTTPATTGLSQKLTFWPGSYGGAASTSERIWGAQTEAGPLTSYIPTTTAAVTRAADALTLTGTLFRGEVGTVYYGTGNYAYFAPGASSTSLGSASAGLWLNANVSKITMTRSVPVPPMAAAAGYDMLVQNDFLDFSASNVDTGCTNATGKRWYCGSASPSLTLNADGSITGQPTVTAGGTLVSAVVTSGSSYVGTAFSGGFYAQAEFKFNPANIVTADGWPAWWAYPLEHDIAMSTGSATWDQWTGQASGYEHFDEVDFFEAIGAGSDVGHLHDHYGVYNTTCSNYCDYQLQAYSYAPLWYSYTTYHTYGVLYTPATATSNGSAKFYRDGALIGSHTWTQYVGSSDTPPPSGSTTWAFGVGDAQHLFLNIGAGSNAGAAITIEGVQVFQATTASTWHQ